MESNVVEVQIAKDNLDGSIFTPNKIYSIQNHVAPDEYNGDYTLVEKKEIIMNSNGVFRGSCEFRLAKIGTIQNIGDTVTDSKNVLIYTSFCMFLNLLKIINTTFNINF